MLLKSLIAAGFPATGVSQFRVRSSGGNASDLACCSVFIFHCPRSYAIGKTRGKESVHLTVISKPPSDYAKQNKPCHWNPRQ